MNWQYNPDPILDRNSIPLKSHQVEQVLQWLYGVDKGLHTREWFLDLLKLGDDGQVIRYILENCEWAISTRRGKVKLGVIPRLESYLDSLEEEEYPEIPVDRQLIHTYLEQREVLPRHIVDVIDRLEMVWHNYGLAHRLNEGRPAIRSMQEKLQDLLAQIHILLNPEQIEGSGAEEGGVELPTQKAQEFESCEQCGSESFDWLADSERAILFESFEGPQLSKSQHQLRHLVMELKDATAARNRYYIMELKDDIEDLHTKIERLRSKQLRNPYFFRRF